MDAYLAKRIREKSDSERLSTYIINSLDFFMDKNKDMYDVLCNSLIELIDYHDLKFITENRTSYFSSKKNIIGINTRDMTNMDCATFIHELTHAIHWLFLDFRAPEKYGAERESRVQNPEFKDALRDLMKVIVQMKRYIHKKFLDSHPIDISVECKNIITYNSIYKLDKDKYILDIKKDINKVIDDKKYVNVINRFGKEASDFLAEIERLNKKFEEVIDNIRLNRNEKPDQLFFVLSSLEGVLDSLLLGSLFEGYHNDCLYVRGEGHEKSYFAQDSRLSFMELLADYTVIKTYNNPLIIKMVRNALGAELYTLLEEIWEGIMGRSFNNQETERRTTYA